MQKEKQLKSCCKKMLSSREVVARDLPHPMLLLNKEKPLCFTRKAEDPRTLRAAKHSEMTNFFNNGNICPTLYSVQKHYGMTSVGRGFTLIELLVVVLIIGILAAVALPQYQKAAVKSRVAQVLSFIKTIKNAEEVYYLANGTYTDDIENLSVEGDLPHGWTFELVSQTRTVYAVIYENGQEVFNIASSFDHRQDHSEWAGTTYCYAKKGTKYEPVCKSMGTPLTTDGSYIRYKMY